jgi:glycerol kinase
MCGPTSGTTSVAGAAGYSASLLPQVHPSSAHHFGEVFAPIIGHIPIMVARGPAVSPVWPSSFPVGIIKHLHCTGFMLMHWSSPQTWLRFTTSAAQATAQTEFAIEGSACLSVGWVQWLRDGLNATARGGSSLAESVPDLVAR